MTTPAEAGVEVAKLLKKKPAMSKSQRRLHRKWLKQNAGVNLNPRPKPEDTKPIQYERFETVPVAEDKPWAKVKFSGEQFVAEECVILTRNAEGDSLRLFLGLKQVRLYVDQFGGVLARPAQSGAATGTSASHGTGQEGVSEGSKKRSRTVLVVLKGTRGLNPAKEGSKRFFLVESMLEGGKPKAIVARAAKAYKEATGDTEEYGIPDTPSNIRTMYSWLMSKVERAGKVFAFTEQENGEFKIAEE